MAEPVVKLGEELQVFKVFFLSDYCGSMQDILEKKSLIRGQMIHNTLWVCQGFKSVYFNGCAALALPGACLNPRYWSERGEGAMGLGVLLPLVR